MRPRQPMHPRQPMACPKTRAAIPSRAKTSPATKADSVADRSAPPGWSAAAPPRAVSASRNTSTSTARRAAPTRERLPAKKHPAAFAIQPRRSRVSMASRPVVVRRSALGCRRRPDKSTPGNASHRAIRVVPPFRRATVPYARMPGWSATTSRAAAPSPSAPLANGACKWSPLLRSKVDSPISTVDRGSLRCYIGCHGANEALSPAVGPQAAR
jgi:hypothetical protein